MTCTSEAVRPISQATKSKNAQGKRVQERRVPGPKLITRPFKRHKNVSAQTGVIHFARVGFRRAFDVICAAAGLVFLSPIFAIIIAAIKLGDGGPIFFSQLRVGKNLRTFHIRKFRSMVPNSSGTILLTALGDPRITRVGRFLRKYKLDELPQLFNVVCGEMQLVGVRPQVERYVLAYPREYKLLLEDRPGITDLASLAYRHEDRMFQPGPLERQYISQILPDKLKIALQYRQTRSFVSDLRILFRTVWNFTSWAADSQE